MKATKSKKTNTRNLNEIIMISAWGFTIVISSFLFLFLGRWIDVRFNTEPAFMLGLFIVAISLCFGRLYMDFTNTSKQIRKVRRHQA